MSKRASETALAGLHATLALTLAGLCQEQTVEETDAEGNVKTRKVAPSPAALAVARAFLKDNNITATPEQSSEVDALASALAKRGGPSKEELREAETMTAKGLLQ